MPNWWLEWAERIARVLAERWLRSRRAGGGAPPAQAERPADPGRGDPPPPGDPGGASRDPS